MGFASPHIEIQHRNKPCEYLLSSSDHDSPQSPSFSTCNTIGVNLVKPQGDGSIPYCTDRYGINYMAAYPAASPW